MQLLLAVTALSFAYLWPSVVAAVLYRLCQRHDHSRCQLQRYVHVGVRLHVGQICSAVTPAETSCTADAGQHG